MVVSHFVVKHLILKFLVSIYLVILLLLTVNAFLDYLNNLGIDWHSGTFNFYLLQSLPSTPCVSCRKFYLGEERIFCIVPGIAAARILRHESSTRVFLL